MKNVNLIKIIRVKLFKKNGGICKFFVKDDLKGNFKDIMKKYYFIKVEGNKIFKNNYGY